jgi:DNA-binding CsgD family transcriptional regulator
MGNAKEMTPIECANEFAKILQSEILTLDDIAQILALTVFSTYQPQGTGIFEVSSMGKYSSIGSYGCMALVKSDRQDISTSSLTPIALAIRSNRIVVTENNKKLGTDFPGAADVPFLMEANSFIAVPIHRFGMTLGAYAVAGGTEIETEPDLPFLELIGTLIAGKLISQVATKLEITIASKEVLIGIPLTKRESQVQILMGDGKTNRQISDELGYSESTIRQDAVSMFAKLDVKNRKDAGNLLHVVK